MDAWTQVRLWLTRIVTSQRVKYGARGYGRGGGGAGNAEDCWADLRMVVLDSMYVLRGQLNSYQLPGTERVAPVK